MSRTWRIGNGHEAQTVIGLLEVHLSLKRNGPAREGIQSPARSPTGKGGQTQPAAPFYQFGARTSNEKIEESQRYQILRVIISYKIHSQANRHRYIIALDAVLKVFAKAEWVGLVRP